MQLRRQMKTTLNLLTSNIRNLYKETQLHSICNDRGYHTFSVVFFSFTCV